MLSKTDIMWIRCCKARDSERRLKRWYKMAYGVKTLENRILCHMLLGICEKIGNIKLSYLADQLSPWHQQFYKVDGKYDYYYHLSCILIGQIAVTSIKDIPDYIPGARWRKTSGI